MIPATIHLIWLGSSLPNMAHQPYRKHIRQWRALNPTWSVCVWANPEDMSSNDWGYLEKWARRCAIRLRCVDSFWQDPELGSALCDVHQAGRFASASDILRVLILRAEGGIYVDTDVLPMTLDRQCVPTGVGLVIKFHDDRVRSVLPHAMLMAPQHPLADLMVEQLDFNLRFFRQDNLSWMSNTKREFQYAATVGVTGTVWTLLMLRLKDTERAQLAKLQLPYALYHEEHNSWLEPLKGPKKQWRPLEYLASQREWAERQPKTIGVQDLHAQYAHCTIGE